MSEDADAGPECNEAAAGDTPDVGPLDRPVVIGLLTYKRPELLADALPLLTDQLATLGDLPEGSCVLVVDNDPDASARLAAAEVPGVAYVHEPTPGIAAARQAALEAAPAGALLAFIDDDEHPETGWLAHLVSTWVRFDRPAGVAGRVLPAYQAAPSDWVVAGGFFVRRSLPTGTPVQAAGAGSLLLDLAQVDRLGVSFDASLGLKGGEDTLFTRQLTHRGGRLLWCEEARATDLVPVDRTTRRWVLQRAFSHAGAAARVDLSIADTPLRRAATRARLVGGGLARVPASGLLYLRGLVRRSPRDRARAPWLAMRGLGLAAGGMGYGLVEYRRSDSAATK
ncbi:glycosyltransferase family 2 protein [Propioniciclava soli]|uniref:glycosyltransferase family 2 protein n=1 Tax=Propioniciclava soli TaxID=2775081 RepID=UPI001E42941F|nr:glycosyltransferase [Propioniciclava soli]